MFVALELPPRSWTVAVARHCLEQLLIAENVAEEVRGNLAIVMTEACTNVIRHADAADPYRVRAHVEDDQCVVEVVDGGVGFDPARGLSEMPDPESDHGGRGLPLIRALTETVVLERLQPCGMRLRAVTQLNQHVATPVP